MAFLSKSFSLDKRDSARIRQISNNIGNIDDEIRRQLRRRADNTISRMQRAAPIDTGRLERHIGYDFTGSLEVEFDSFAIDPETNEDYAPIQEFGTRFIPAHPYFYKNIRKFTKQVPDIIFEAITDFLVRNPRLKQNTR